MYYLITIPQAGSQPKQFITDDIAWLTGKYPYFMIQKIDFEKCPSVTQETANS